MPPVAHHGYNLRWERLAERGRKILPATEIKNAVQFAAARATALATSDATRGLKTLGIM